MSYVIHPKIYTFSTIFINFLYDRSRSSAYTVYIYLYQRLGHQPLALWVINHWRPFNLSLPGRICIAKSMMYSQVNYLGCFTPIPVVSINEYDNLITTFVKGKLNIAKKRLYLPTEHGGLGLFAIDDFLDAQRCMWIKRCIGLDEWWKLIIYASNFACPFDSKSKNINPDEFPIAHNICKSFERVSDKFTQTNENFRESFIFENGKIPLNLETRPCINRTMFTAEFFSQHATKLYRLKYSDFYDRDDILIEAETIRETTGIDFTLLQIFAIRGACLVARIKYKKKIWNFRSVWTSKRFFIGKSAVVAISGNFWE
jgi:hypothetical protein